MTLMFQKEVAERIVAAPGSKAYGRLSVLAQALCEAKIVMELPARAFTPPPKVASAVVRLTPKADRPPEDLIEALQRLTAAAFGQRRKMLRSSLKPLGGESLCAEAGVDPNVRAENVTVAAYLEMARSLASWRPAAERVVLAHLFARRRQMPDSSTQQPPPVGLGHMAMTVADLEASHRFYASFGLRSLGKSEGMAILELRGGTHLLLFQKDGPDDVPTDSPFEQPPAQSIDLMIAGRTLEELEDFRAGLVAKGLAPDPILERRFFGHYVFKTKDPNGAEVTVSTSHASEHPV
jgi:catechol 2,3-dioxygenase-like lactoylglutathione lyase family enzyme